MTLCSKRNILSTTLSNGEIFFSLPNFIEKEKNCANERAKFSLRKNFSNNLDSNNSEAKQSEKIQNILAVGGLCEVAGLGGWKANDVDGTGTICHKTIKQFYWRKLRLGSMKKLVLLLILPRNFPFVSK